MNPFDAHSQSLSQYRGELSEPVAGVGASTPNTIVFGGATYPAVVGIFEVLQMLTDGGTTPMLAAPVLVRRQDAPADITWPTGKAITVIGLDGTARACKIESVDLQPTVFRLLVKDLKQGI